MAKSCFFCFFINWDKVEVHKNKQKQKRKKKRTRPISNHLDRSSLVRKVYIILQKICFNMNQDWLVYSDSWVRNQSALFEDRTHARDSWLVLVQSSLISMFGTFADMRHVDSRISNCESFKLIQNFCVFIYFHHRSWIIATYICLSSQW